nr:GNAT family N-acetyltransferase [uncultured Pseudomonas sp.]
MDSQIDLKRFTSKVELEGCFEVMKQLRPHLVSPQSLIEQLQRQFKAGYELLGGSQGGRVVGLVGYREMENLLYGRFIYVDDLVVDSSIRQMGLGAQLLDAVRQQAKARGCAHFVLDTGLHMPLAQRFYFREGLLARGMHFVEPLSSSRG